MFTLLIDPSDKRLPNGNVKGKGFVLKREFVEAYRAARKAQEKELSHVGILSSSYKRIKNKFEKNKYVSGQLYTLESTMLPLSDSRQADTQISIASLLSDEAILYLACELSLNCGESVGVPDCRASVGALLEALKSGSLRSDLCVIEARG